MSYTDIALNMGVGICGAVIAARLADLIIKSRRYKYFRDKVFLSNTDTLSKLMDVILPTTHSLGVVEKTLSIFLSSSLYSAVSIITAQIVNAAPENKQTRTLVGMMIGEKIRTSLKSQMYLVIALLIHLAYTGFSASKVNGFIVLIIAIGFLAIYMDQKLIEYRVKKGWYGRNRYEAKEIIDFIISHAEKQDFNDNDGLKQVIPNAEHEDKNEFVKGFNGVSS